MLQQAACTAADQHQWLEVVREDTVESLRYHSHLPLCVLRRAFASGYQTPAIALFQAKSRQSPLTLWPHRAVQNASMAQKQPGYSKALI